MQDPAARLRHDRATENSLVVILGIKQGTALQTDNRRSGLRLRIRLRVGKHGVDGRRIALTVRGEGTVRSRKLQHGSRNGIVTLPHTSLFTGFAVKRRNVRRVIKMGAVGDHVYRACSSKANVLLPLARLPLDLAV